MNISPLEQAPRPPESPPIMMCPTCAGKKFVMENGKQVPCKHCGGAGGFRDNRW